jgi:hypothetical protein
VARAALNRDRFCRSPRCVVAFQVRRHSKERRSSISGSSFDIKMKEDADKWTFLYMRNGERLYRLKTGVEFDRSCSRTSTGSS